MTNRTNQRKSGCGGCGDNRCAYHGVRCGFDVLSNPVVSSVRVACVLWTLVFGLALSAPEAIANADQEASFQDNALMMDPATVGPTMQALRSIGVDRLVVSVNWYKVAPAAESRKEPADFDGANPADYPASGWAPYDRIVRQAKAYGLSVNFDVMGGAPLWAVGRAPAPSMVSVWYPSAAKLGAFFHALGERYSGDYQPAGASTPLPAVRYWSIWNEPNVGSSSLSPQTVRGVEVAPALYRSMLDAGWSALLSTGHRPDSDTIVVGQTASTGHLNPGAEFGMQPLRFLRALYCVDSSYRPLAGAAARNASARSRPLDPSASPTTTRRSFRPAVGDIIPTGWARLRRLRPSRRWVLTG